MYESPKTIAPCGCAVFIVLSVWIGGGGLAYIAMENYKSTQKQDWWILVLIAIPQMYLAMKSILYLFPLVTRDFYSHKWYIIGRFLSFLAFPCFAYIIALLVWYISRTTSIAAVLGLIVGWLVTKILHKTLFARETV